MIGASDAPAILGVSPYETPWQCWARLLGLIEPRPADDAMTWGSRLEAVVLDTYAELHGWKGAVLTSPHTRRCHDIRTWQRATPDGVVCDETGSPRVLIEIKCVIGHPPSVPRVDWLVQCLHQELVYEEATEHHLVCYGNLSLDSWIIPRHPRALARVLREEEAFLRLLETETPPPVRAADAAFLARAWPMRRDAIISLGTEALEWDQTLLIARAEATVATTRKEEAEAQLKAAIGDAAGAVLPNGTHYIYRPDRRGRRSLRRRKGGPSNE